MLRKIVLIALSASLLTSFGCDKMGITKKEDEKHKSDLIERVLDKNQTAADLQQQIVNLQAENQRLNSVITENENDIKDMQGQLASAAASAQNLAGEIASAKKAKTVVSVIAIISLIFNALFLWMLFGAKKRESHPALPPARESGKKDIDILKYSPNPPASPSNTKPDETDTITKARQASAKNVESPANASDKKKTAKKNPAKKTDAPENNK